MIELFQMGGVLFMSLLSLSLLVVLILAIRYLLKVEKKPEDLDLIKSLGLLAVVLGVLGQLLGLYSAFQAIEEMGSASPALLVGGLKISSITTIYGLIIYLVTLAFGVLVNVGKTSVA